MNLQAVKQRFGIIGNSPELDRALDTAVRVAGTDLSVLIMGESGVGKEVFSRIIHSLSSRKHNKFIAINTGAIPEGTINSELFGHEKGAFTGATGDRKGYFETVNGGTIFLDEIGEMPLETQVFLLRVLESGEFIRVGGSKTQKTDVRIVAATNVSLEEAVKKGKFRQDLYYRLSTVPIQVPSLRERQEDINLLFRKFAVDFAERQRTPSIQLDEKAKLLLEKYHWPGNIRELKNVAQKISVLSRERLITADNLIDHIPNILRRNLPVPADHGQDNANFQEREILYKLLFEMKHDLNELKKLVFELVSTNNLRMPELKDIRQLQPSYAPQAGYFEASNYQNYENNNYGADNFGVKQRTVESEAHSLVINAEDDYQELEEEDLSLEDMEIRFISKALEKHNGKRKDAALELGISERTLYRKIDKYQIKS